MKLFTSIAAAAAVIGTSFIAANPAEANPSQCQFNGKWESCTVMRSGNNYTVRWNSDGKVVTYNPYDCYRPSSWQTGRKCKVKIVEDNGRISYGTFIGGGRGLHVESNNGNYTAFPPAP